MEIERVLCYGALIVAGLVCLVFLLDLSVGLLGRNPILDLLFIIGGAFVLWQGIETAREFR
jgi:threonine/homoserine/homoserine lactone efflux protein